jgi:hypothetical protein
MSMRGSVVRCLWAVSLGLVVSAAGCGGGPDIKVPPLAKVTGTVTIDGQPGAELLVTFIPEGTAVAGAAMAITDAGGKYELKYRGEQPGAVVGKNKVQIARAAGGGPAGGMNAVATTPIPARYNEQTTLTVDVQAKDNDIPLEIKAK